MKNLKVWQVIDGLSQAATGMRQGASRFKVAA
jgi:hypothetical protein